MVSLPGGATSRGGEPDQLCVSETEFARVRRPLMTQPAVISKPASNTASPISAWGWADTPVKANAVDAVDDVDDVTEVPEPDVVVAEVTVNESVTVRPLVPVNTI